MGTAVKTKWSKVVLFSVILVDLHLEIMRDLFRALQRHVAVGSKTPGLRDKCAKNLSLLVGVMAATANEDSKGMYSWWWGSHITPKNSKWLMENVTGIVSLLMVLLSTALELTTQYNVSFDVVCLA